jgi:hypothetical protein
MGVPLTKSAATIRTTPIVSETGLMEKMDFSIIRINHSVHEIFSTGS